MAAKDDNAGPALLVIAIVMVVLCVLSTSLRCWIRYTRKFLGPDDYTIAAATLLAIGRVTIQCISVPYGNGRHRQFLDEADYRQINFLTWLTQLFLFPLLCLLKLSVCLLVLRIKNTKALRYSLWTVMAGLLLATLLPEVVLLAECNPVSAYWNSQPERCWNPKVRIYSIYFQTAMSVLTDIICTLLPIAVVWDLTLSLRDKVAVCGLMSLGVISTTFALVRASSLGLNATDLSWTYCWAAIWGDIEFGTGILGANLALSRTYFEYFAKGLRTLTNPSKGHDAGYDQEYDLSGYNNRAIYVGPISQQPKLDVEVRRGSYARSDESQAPLDPGISRKVEIQVSRADRQHSEI
ncbi:hypothetical protein LTR08_003252 [Meristemomyces frigidus]|nr:hypothetical protein LTR08_003252 [Meristemomyces frigidus]